MEFWLYFSNVKFEPLKNISLIFILMNMDLLLLSSRQNSADTSVLNSQRLIRNARQTARNEQDGRQHQSMGDSLSHWANPSQHCASKWPLGINSSWRRSQNAFVSFSSWVHLLEFLKSLKNDSEYFPLGVWSCWLLSLSCSPTPTTVSVPEGFPGIWSSATPLPPSLFLKKKKKTEKRNRSPRD